MQSSENASKDPALRSARYAEQTRRISRVRYLRAMGHSKSEAQSVCSKEFGIKRRSLIPYLAAAAELSREPLNDSHDDSLANALHFWILKLQARETELETLDASIARVDEQLATCCDSKERHSLLREADNYRKRHFLASEQQLDIRDRIDRLMGLIQTGGSGPSVVINQAFGMGGQLSLEQRREQLEAMGMAVAPALPAPLKTIEQT